MVEIIDVAVSAADLELAKERNPAAIRRLRESVKGLRLYFHAMPLRDGEVIVSIVELHELGVISSVTIDCEFPPGAYGVT